MMPIPEQFELWFRVNYPEMILAYHAPKIYRAAIAASPLPELLEAAKQALPFISIAELGGDVKAYNALLEAIHKAEGR